MVGSPFELTNVELGGSSRPRRGFDSTGVLGTADRRNAVVSQSDDQTPCSPLIGKGREERNWAKRV